MTQWGLLLNGKYRETLMDSGVVNYVEKYTRAEMEREDCIVIILH